MHRTSDISNRIRQFIMNRFPLARHQSIIDDDALLGTQIIDSLGILELVTFMEEEFKITISDEDLLAENFQSIACLTCFVQNKRESLSALPSAD
jgi:acyl carrier protein